MIELAGASADVDTVTSLLDAPTSCGIWLTGPAPTETRQTADPRVNDGPVPPSAISSARIRIRLSGPMRVPADGWADLLGTLMEGGAGRVRLTTNGSRLDAVATRAQSRADRWQAAWPDVDLIDRLFPASTLPTSTLPTSTLPTSTNRQSVSRS